MIYILAAVLTGAVDVGAQREATDQRLVVKLVFDPVEDPALAMFLDDSLKHSYRVSVGNLLGQDDVSSARLSTEDGTQLLVLKLTKAGVAQMHVVTSRYRGRQVALAVDKRVWAAPIIRGDLPGDEWFVGVRASSDELKGLVDWINDRAKRPRGGEATPASP